MTVSWEDEDFKCKVLEVSAGSVKVHYVGWNAGHDGWVSAEAFRRGNETEGAKDTDETKDDNSGMLEESGQ